MEMYVSSSDILHFFKKKWVSFLVVVLLFGGVCALLPLKTAQYTYSANSTITFSCTSSKKNDPNYTLQYPGILNVRINTAVAEASSNDLVEKTAAQLNIDPKIIYKITGEQLYSSSSVKLTVQTASDTMAAKISDTAAKILGEEIKKQYPQPELTAFLTEKAVPAVANSKKSAMVKSGVLGLVLGFVVFLCYGLIRVLCNHTVHNGPAAEEALKIKYLGGIPSEKHGDGRPNAFRRMRPVVLNCFGGAKSLLVEGIRENGHKEVAVGLATAFAQSGRKVLLVEADLHAPELTENLGAIPAKTLRDLLDGSCTFEQAVTPIRQQPGLWLLAAAQAGSENPADLLAQGFENLLQEAESRYDNVIICAPPEALYPDADSLAPTVQGVVISVASGVTTYRELHSALSAARESGGKKLGFVLTGI